MFITKLGHCCLLIEENGIRILTDPGNQSTLQDEVKNIHIILITHEHPDHFHTESLRVVLTNNPTAKIITNTSVGALLTKENIPFTVLEDAQTKTEQGIEFKGFGTTHAEIHKLLPSVQNTGYFIAKRLFYPGDALTNPRCPIDILALPVAGPWIKISEAIDYALELKPKLCFPVHDAIVKSPGIAHAGPTKILPPAGIKFQVLEIGTPTEL